jgi:two-component system sensor histidine kinase TctE
MSSIRTSIRRSLLRWVLAGLASVVLLSLGVAALVARSTADRAYDQALYAVAADIASTVHMRDEGVALTISDESETFLRNDEVDHLYFCVRDAQGRLIGGDHDLQPWPAATPAASHPAYFRDHAVQVMTVSFTHARIAFTVTVAETARKRAALFKTIVTSLLVPTAVLLAFATLVIWLAVRQGLKPLTVLEREIAMRNASDLAPIDEAHIPQEAASLGDALNRLLAQVREATQRQRRFVADAAHQLRTPLAGIQAETELLRQQPSTPDSALHLARLVQSVKRMVRLTSQLLALARSEPGADRAVQAQPLDLAAVVQQGADEWFHRALARRIDLGFALQPARLTGDAGLLGELVANLVDNALIYTPPGGEVTVSTGGDTQGAYLWVDDNGPGVDEAERERVFERFYRGAATAVRTEGVGLGLAIVREIADAHGAVVRITRAPAGGARFELRVPAPGATDPRALTGVSS